MSIKRYNKTTAASVAGAVAVLASSFFVLEAEQVAAIQTIITAILVWLVPNKEG